MCAAWAETGAVVVPSARATVRSFLRRRVGRTARTSVDPDGPADGAGPRVVWCDLDGPLCAAHIVVATESWDDSGLPHTLEHLVFCGSQSTPHRGYLDTVAMRALSTGTNAWTAEDHTAYTAVTAGATGLVQLLPVFLDHVIHPTLREPQFVTEVYHVDGEGRERGVVFSEMNGRENSEADLLENTLRQLLYPDTCFVYEHGGKTRAIATLTNERVRAYHAHYYNPAHMTIVLCGRLDIDAVFRALDTVDFDIAQALPAVVTRSSIPRSVPMLAADVAKQVSFPSHTADVASISFAWHGPAFDDLETIVALEVLMRFLMETSASPVPQRFVERPDPLASSASYELNMFNQTNFVIQFAGVAMGKLSRSRRSGTAADDAMDEGHGTLDKDEGGSEGGDDNDDDDESEDGEEGDEDDEDDDDEEDEPADEVGGRSLDSGDTEVHKNGEMVVRENVLAPGAFLALLRALFAELLRNGLPVDVMRKNVRRYRIKMHEAIEDDPIGFFSNALVREAVNTREQQAFGGRTARIPAILDDLEARPSEYWEALFARWLVKAPCVEVQMRPDLALADQLAEEAEKRALETKTRLGAAGLRRQAELVRHAVEANKVDLPPDVLATMPPVPSSDTVSVFPNRNVFHWKTSDAAQAHADASLHRIHAGLGLSAGLETITPTRFVSLHIGLDTAHVPRELREYLVLLQELLLETDVQMPGQSVIDYREVVQQLQEETVSVDCGVGYGNDGFSCGYLDRVFCINGVADRAKFKRMCELLLRLLFFAKFPHERVMTMLRNLLADIADVNRGDELMDAIVVDQIEGPESNAHLMSILHQKPFLRRLMSKVSGADADTQIVVTARVHAVSAALEQLRERMLSNLSLAYFQVAHSGEDGFDPVAIFAGVWSRLQSQYRVTEVEHAEQAAKRAKVAITSPWPFPRDVPRLQDAALLVPIKGVDASYLTQIIPCDVPLNTRAHAAVLLLAELLSRNEGPLYADVRGQGFAYDCAVEYHRWSSQLVFTCHEATAPEKALAAFYEILRRLPTSPGLLNDFTAATSRSCLCFRSHASRSTASQVTSKSLQQALLGNVRATVDDQLLGLLEQVTVQDLLLVHEAYFAPFLAPKRGRVTVVTTTPAGHEQLAARFDDMCGVALTVRPLRQLFHRDA